MLEKLLKRGPLVVAHRGDPLVKPQNTRSSFLSAMQYDIDMIETDINMTKDGRLVIIHDQKVDNTSNGKGRVIDFTLSELLELDFGSWMGEAFRGEKIMTFEEFIELTRDKVGALNIEVKSGRIKYQGIEQKLVDTLKKYDMLDRALISSFDHPLLKRVKEIEPRLMTGVLYSGGLIDPLFPAILAGANAINPEFQWVNAEMIDAAFFRGLFVNVWTVDDENDMRDMVNLKVSSIISNFPGRLASVVKRKA